MVYGYYSWVVSGGWLEVERGWRVEVTRGGVAVDLARVASPAVPDAIVSPSRYGARFGFETCYTLFGARRKLGPRRDGKHNGALATRQSHAPRCAQLESRTAPTATLGAADPCRRNRTASASAAGSSAEGTQRKRAPRLISWRSQSPQVSREQKPLNAITLALIQSGFPNLAISDPRGRTYESSERLDLAHCHWRKLNRLAKRSLLLRGLYLFKRQTEYFLAHCPKLQAARPSALAGHQATSPLCVASASRIPLGSRPL